MAVADSVLGSTEGTVLDLLDRLLDKGVMATGDVMLGVAGIDLIYVRLSALLCAAERVVDPAARRDAGGRSLARRRTARPQRAGTKRRR